MRTRIVATTGTSACCPSRYSALCTKFDAKRFLVFRNRYQWDVVCDATKLNDFGYDVIEYLYSSTSTLTYEYKYECEYLTTRVRVQSVRVRVLGHSSTSTSTSTIKLVLEYYSSTSTEYEYYNTAYFRFGLLNLIVHSDYRALLPIRTIKPDCRFELSSLRTNEPYFSFGLWNLRTN